MGRRFVEILLSSALAASCGLDVVGVMGGKAADATAGDGGPTAGDGSSPSVEGGSDANANPDAPIDGPIPSPTCKGSAGPTAIKVGTYCIDRTEVTHAEYAAFLASGFSTQPAYCSWNTSFETVATPDDLPMTNIDWCDAWTFCAWAGKRLCTQAESRGGCSPPGQKYPYGTSYQPGRCNDLNAGRNAAVAVASLTCSSALGVQDMIGNVWEWIDKCDAQTGSDDACDFSYGGAWGQSYDCDTTATGFKRNDKAADVGLRCCSDAL